MMQLTIILWKVKRKVILSFLLKFWTHFEDTSRPFPIENDLLKFQKLILAAPTKALRFLGPHYSALPLAPETVSRTNVPVTIAVLINVKAS